MEEYRGGLHVESDPDTHRAACPMQAENVCMAKAGHTLKAQSLGFERDPF